MLPLNKNDFPATTGIYADRINLPSQNAVQSCAAHHSQEKLSVLRMTFLLYRIKGPYLAQIDSRFIIALFYRIVLPLS